MYALFKDGKQISKAHFTTEQCLVEAFELKVIYRGAFRCNSQRLQEGYEIREIKENGDA